MITFISCAKTMTADPPAAHPVLTRPRHLDLAAVHAAEMARTDPAELARLLHVSMAIARENHLRYNDFALQTRPLCPALTAYTGVVFRHIAPDDFTESDFAFAQEHLRISSFLYGLLRPLDGIRNYRMEGNIRLAAHDERTMFEFWRNVLTDGFIREIESAGGVLINLASAEMKGLFDWKRVERSVRVITPEFRQWKDGRLTMVTVYAKMCRGEMVRHIIRNRIDTAEDLKGFSWEGFAFDPEASTPHKMLFTAR